MKKSRLLIILAVNCAFLFAASVAFASEGAGMPWGNLFLRLLNLAIFLGIIWYFAGKMIKNVLDGKAKKVVEEMDTLDAAKKNAVAQLADMEKRVANIEEECARLLEEGKAHAEQVAAVIILDAEKQAKEILRQAEKSAQLSMQAEIESIRARIADEITAEVRKSLASKLDKNTQEKLIDSSLSRVSGF